jgi:hypothetical protein
VTNGAVAAYGIEQALALRASARQMRAARYRVLALPFSRASVSGVRPRFAPDLDVRARRTVPGEKEQESWASSA